VKITADTNLLVRAITEDDQRQARLAQNALSNAELVAIPVTVLCEFVWVLSTAYGISRSDIAVAIRRLLDTDNVAVDRQSVDAGLAALEAGGDFADGVVAHEGHWLGGEVFVSFDKRAVAIAVAHGLKAEALV